MKPQAVILKTFPYSPFPYVGEVFPNQITHTRKESAGVFDRPTAAHIIRRLRKWGKYYTTHAESAAGSEVEP